MDRFWTKIVAELDDTRTDRRPGWLVAALLLGLTLLVYANSFPGAFILDDLHIVQNSPLVANFDVVTIFRSDYWHGIENSGLYRPLTIFTLALNRLLLGEATWGFHLVNVLLHGSVAVLIWLTLPRWGLPRAVALLAALLFSVHPLHTEVVNLAVGRSELLVALLLTAAFYFARDSGRRAGIPVALCFFAALLAKENAITFLALLPLWEAFRARNWRIWRERWPLYAALLALAGLWLVLRTYVVIATQLPANYSHEGAPLAFVPWGVRVLSALQYQGLYLAKLFLPHKLQVAYSTADLPPFITSPWSLSGLLILVSTAVVAALLVIGWRRRSPIALFATLYAVSFAPTANLFFPIGVTVAERLTYYPSLWFCAGVAAAIGLLLRQQHWRRLGWGLCAVYLLLLAAICVVRNPDFGSETRLWNAEVVDNRGDFLAWQNLAESLSNGRRYLEADAAYRHMLELAPDYPGGLRARSAFFRTLGRYQEALEPASRALAIALERNDLPAVSYDHVELADIYLGLKNYPAALTHLDQVDPRMGVTSRLLVIRGKALAGLDRCQEATETIERIVSLSAQTDIRLPYSLCLLKLGRLEEARLQLEAEVKREETADAWNLIGVVCAQQGDLANAVQAFERASMLAPESQYHRDNLERARALLGR